MVCNLKRMKKMKKILALFATLALVCAVSCEKEEMGEAAIMTGNTQFTADVDSDDEARTALNGTSTVWSDSDRLSVFDGVSNNLFAIVENNLSTARFRGDVEEAASYTAIHPYTAGAALTSKGVVTGAVVKATQTATAGSYDPEAALSIALTEDNTLKFKNVCSMFKFTALSSGKLTIKSNTATEYLAGTVTVTYDGVNDPTAVVTANGSNSVSITGLQQGKTYCIAVLPIKISAGFTVLFDDVEVRTVNSAVQLKRSQILNLGEFGSKSGWSVVGTFNDWNALRHPMFYGSNGLLVCKNVSLATTNTRKGFKFCYNNWTNQYGAYGYDTQQVNIDSQLNKWYNATPNNSNFKGDIVLNTSYRYDVYLDLACNRFYVTKAGGAMPSHIVSVVGSFGSENWGTDHDCVFENGWYVAKNLSSSSAIEFKFRLNHGWDISMGWNGSGSAVSGTIYNTGGSNVKVAAGKYDIYLRADFSQFKVVKK